VATLLQSNARLKLLYEQCQEGAVSDINYVVKDGLIFWKDKLMIPDNHDLQTQIIQEFHACKIGDTLE
jgi:hypothetical protein